MARQIADVVFDLRRDAVMLCDDEAEVQNLAFTPDGLPTYTRHDGYGSLVMFQVDPMPVSEPTSISAYRFGLA